MSVPRTSSPQDLDPNFAVSQPGSELLWYDGLRLPRTGQGWRGEELERPLDRLPARSRDLIPAAVWSLSRHSAGIEVRFATDAREIGARWTVLNPGLAMDHMPATGVSGLDLYGLDGETWRFLAVGRPTQTPTNQVKLIADLPPGMREYRLYLPLYNGVESLSLGIPKGATLQAPAAIPALPVVCYGTSIVQGGCASRPGMAYPALLGRRLGVPTFNLGFSGNGKAELELARLLGEIEASAYVIDPLPNLTEELVAERIVPFLGALRGRRPGVPILLVENTCYQQSWLALGKLNARTPKNDLLRRLAAPLLSSDPLLSYVASETLLGEDGEATVDGCHPTDLGFSRMADALAPVLEKALGQGPRGDKGGKMAEEGNAKSR
ncbi:MAG: SGNH/GDSL hydrolase family protein [Spirochaetes bacterium]|nr:SGNH/GDSL hydrolase family protein [Spirochaetota bacterium]